MRTLCTGDISIGETSNEDHSMKKGMEAMPGGKFVQSLECNYGHYLWSRYKRKNLKIS